MIVNLNRAELRCLVEYLSPAHTYLDQIIEHGEDCLPRFTSTSPEISVALTTIIYESRQIQHVITPLLEAAQYVQTRHLNTRRDTYD